MLGLQGASGHHACAWCSTHVENLHDLDAQCPVRDWIKDGQKDPDKFWKGVIAKNQGQAQVPIIDFIPLEHVIVDELHLFLRIFDAMMSTLIELSKAETNIETRALIVEEFHRVGTLSALYCFPMIEANFIFFPISSGSSFPRAGISFEFFTSKNGKFAWTTLDGKEKRVLLQQFKLDSVLSGVKGIKSATIVLFQQVWDEFYDLFRTFHSPLLIPLELPADTKPHEAHKLGRAAAVDQDKMEFDQGLLDAVADSFQASAKSWVLKFIHLAGVAKMTFYMHQVCVDSPMCFFVFFFFKTLVHVFLATDGQARARHHSQMGPDRPV